MIRTAGLLLALGILAAARPALAQDMPDPSLIHGRALPASELPNGTVTVRVVREAIGNNIAGQRVSVVVGSVTRASTTDDLGRSEFTNLPGGEGKASVTVEGEALESQPFQVPTTGGLRVILVAGMARAAERKAREEAEAAAAPAVKGIVVLGGNTRVLMQYNNDSLEVYYVLEIVNSARTRVDTGGPLVIDLPKGATGAAALEGSSRAASVTERQITVTGPFASGTTAVQVGFRLPQTSGELVVEQKWPVALQQVTVGVEKVGELAIASPQFSAVNDIRPDGSSVYALGSGPALPAGATLVVTLSNLPYHSTTPLKIALSLAALIVGFGAWLASSGRGVQASERQMLVRRRDELLTQLTQLESRHRAGAVGDDRYQTRRERIAAELEQIYGALDDGAATLGPKGGGEGVAA